MTTRELLDGPITLSDATARCRNVLHYLRYPLLKGAFYARIESHRALLTEVIAHHLGVAPSAVEVSTQDWWRHGSFNLCVPGRVLPTVPAGVPEFFFIRFPLPYRVGETTRPGNADEKLACEAATYAWLEENCPEVPIPRLYGFGLSTNLRYTNCDLLPWWSRWFERIRRALLSTMGFQAPTRYVSHASPRFAALDMGYLIIETITQDEGNMLSESWEEHHTDARRMENLQRGLARIMLSLASIELPRIGSFRLDHHGYLRLDNRPLSVPITMHENEDLPLDLPRQTTFSTSTELVLSHLDAFDRRFLYQPNAIVSEDDARYQMTSLSGARLTLPQLLPPDLARGPFVLALTDLSRSNVFVGADWNITRIIDLEFACAGPVEFWQTPYWLDADYIDDIDYDKLAARHEQFICLMKEEEKHGRFRPQKEPLSSIIQTAWETGTVWISLALRDPVAFTTIFYEHILPRHFNFPENELNDGNYIAFCSRFWSPDVPAIIERKLEDRKAYLGKLETEFTPA
ncbi:hypothetical protein LLEC1_06965 [Akanthomyces lecanii]|uniref:Uncharacterized protein n=1 Tax=Cordyceps confragosa TaxID=2714763 RepID=A0A179I631_CORDF|nr:hypothetical protein LLEC1_06965 [Akanthomyces lecanii]